MKLPILSTLIVLSACVPDYRPILKIIPSGVVGERAGIALIDFSMVPHYVFSKNKTLKDAMSEAIYFWNQHFKELECPLFKEVLEGD